MIVRGLLMALAGVIAWRAYSIIKQSRQPTINQSPPRPIKNTIQCAHCDVHLDKAEAIQRDNHYYCNRNHADNGPTSVNV